METLPAPPAVTLPEPDPVFLAAARLLREGWSQGQMRREPNRLLRLLGARTRYCLWGALNAVIPPGASGRYSTFRLCEALGLDDPMGWNDEPGRTQEEVVERVERAAYGL